MRLRLFRRRRGNNAIEFALMFPMVALLVLGTLQWAGYFLQWEAATLACRAGVREGSRTLMSSNPASAAETAAQRALAAHYPFTLSGATYSGSIVSTDIVRLTVTVPAVKILNLGWISTPTNATAKCQMKVEKNI